jgi:hypothetical protein
VSDEGGGLLAALKAAASPADSPAPAGKSSAQAAFERFQEKQDLASFRELVDEVLDEAEED